MKKLEQHHLHFISGSVNLAPVLYFGALSSFMVVSSYYLAKHGKAATQEEEEYYALTQFMIQLGHP